MRLFFFIGCFFFEGNNVFVRVDDIDVVVVVVDYIVEYKVFFDKVGVIFGGGVGMDEVSLSLEDEFFKYDVDLNK